ncbi:hypothetical protein B0H21DRAFT_894008 [Amylocystis lapponica]|nr:hypothetical protein B0H21DRAFT_894008 [Amylocystis lapponica]
MPASPAQPPLAPGAIACIALTALVVSLALAAGLVVLLRRARPRPRPRPVRRCPRPCPRRAADPERDGADAETRKAEKTEVDAEDAEDAEKTELDGGGGGGGGFDVSLSVPRVYRLEGADGESVGVEMRVTPPTPEGVAEKGAAGRRGRFEAAGAGAQSAAEASWWFM